MASASVTIPSQAMLPATWYSMPVHTSSRSSGPLREVRRFGPRAGEQSPLARWTNHRSRMAWFCAAMSGRQLYFQIERGLENRFLGVDIAQAHLGASLAEEVVREAPLAVIDPWEVFPDRRPGEIFAVEEPSMVSFLPDSKNRPAFTANSRSPSSLAISSAARSAAR